MTLCKGDACLGLRYVDTNDGPKAQVIRWLGGKRVIEYERLPFRHYGFVRTDKLAHIDVSNIFDVDFADTTLKTTSGERVTQISVAQPGDLKQAFMQNTNVQFYEADVPYGKKAFNDLGLKLPDEYKPAYCDIETDPRNVTQKAMQNAQKRVVSAAFADDTFYCDDKPLRSKGVSANTFICSDSEAQIFSDLNKHLQNYTCMVSWSDFDFTYLRQRAFNCNHRAPFVTNIEGVDMMYYFAQLVLKKTSNQYCKLVDAVKKMQDLGADVDSMPDMGVKQDYSKVWQFFESDRESLRRYNVADAVAMKQIDDELQLTHGMYELMRLLRIWPQEFRQHSKIDDMLKLRLARARGVVLPNRPTKRLDMRKEKADKKGAYVFTPAAGYHEHILVFDFAGMYPSIMTSLNIGLDSLQENGAYVAPNGKRYSEHDCLNTEYLKLVQKYFVNYDAELKAAKPDSLEYAKATAKRLKMKLIKNATFGVNGYKTSRMYDKDVFESITMTGVALIKFASQYMLSRYGMPTIYGDTDSIMIKLPGPLSEQKLVKSLQALNLAIQEYSKHAFGAAIDTEIDLDYYADRAYFTTAKKRYLMHVALQDWPPKACDYTKITGFETVRRDSTQLLRDVQKLVFEPLLKGVAPSELEKQYMAHFKQLKRDLFAGKLDDKIVFTKSIRDDLADYETSLPHTRAAKILQDMGQYSAGSDIEYVVLSCDRIAALKPCGKCEACKQKLTNCFRPKRQYKDFIDAYPAITNRPAIRRSGYEYVWQNQVANILERLGMYVTDKEIMLAPEQSAMTAYFRNLSYSPLVARFYS